MRMYIWPTWIYYPNHQKERVRTHTNLSEAFQGSDLSVVSIDNGF